MLAKFYKSLSDTVNVETFLVVQGYVERFGNETSSPSFLFLMSGFLSYFLHSRNRNACCKELWV